MSSTTTTNVINEYSRAITDETHENEVPEFNHQIPGFSFEDNLENLSFSNTKPSDSLLLKEISHRFEEENKALENKNNELTLRIKHLEEEFNSGIPVADSTPQTSAPLSFRSHHQLEEEELNLSTFGLLQNQLKEVQNMCNRQDYTLERFEETLEENENKNDKLMELLGEVYNDRSGLSSPRLSKFESRDFTHEMTSRKVSEFNSLFSFDDAEFFRNIPEIECQRPLKNKEAKIRGREAYWRRLRRTISLKEDAFMSHALFLVLEV